MCACACVNVHVCIYREREEEEGGGKEEEEDGRSKWFEVWKIQPTIVDFENGGREPLAKERMRCLEAKNDSRPIASKEMGTLVQ